jgi:hypothetical protein
LPAASAAVPLAASQAVPAPVSSGDLYEQLTQPSTKQSLLTAAVQANDYCDVRLADLDISSWIDTPMPNELAAHVISLYLETDHALVGSFDPDLFVTDLIGRRTNHCSSLLVVAVLYFGYVGDPAPLLLGTARLNLALSKCTRR